MTTQEQVWIPGTEPPRNAAIESAIDDWQTARDEQKRAADRTKIKHASLLAALADAGLERYPFVDARTGKKHVVARVAEPKAKVMRGARTKKAKTAKQERADEKREEKRAAKKAAEEDAVESRRVARTSEHDRLADPFAATRGELSNGHREGKK